MAKPRSVGIIETGKSAEYSSLRATKTTAQPAHTRKHLDPKHCTRGCATCGPEHPQVRLAMPRPADCAATRGQKANKPRGPCSCHSALYGTHGLQPRGGGLAIRWHMSRPSSPAIQRLVVTAIERQGICAHHKATRTERCRTKRFVPFPNRSSSCKMGSVGRGLILAAKDKSGARVCSADAPRRGQASPIPAAIAIDELNKFGLWQRRVKPALAAACGGNGRAGSSSITSHAHVARRLRLAVGRSAYRQ